MTSAACRKQKLGPVGVSWASQLCDESDGIRVPDRTLSLDLLPKPFPLTTVCSVCVSSGQLLPGPAKHLPAQRSGGKSVEARAAYYLGNCVHRCGQSESSRQVGAGWDSSSTRQTQGRDIDPGQVAAKHLERQATVFRSQHGPVEGSPARLRSLPFWTHYDRWS